MKRLLSLFSLLSISFLFFGLTFLISCNPADHSLVTANRAGYFFDKPARIWEETIPLGNGRIGLMPDGGVDQESVLLNEISMWSGSKQDTDNPQAYLSLAKIRSLLFEGRNDEAQELMYQTFICKGEGSGVANGAHLPYGSYQLVGHMLLDYAYPTGGEATTYRRELKMDEAIAAVSFKKGDVRYFREAFTSFSSDVGVVHLTADTDKALNFSIGLNRPEHATVSVEGNDLLMQGRLSDGVDTVEMKGTRFGVRLRIVLPKGGTINTGDTMLTVSNASEAIVLVSMKTDYFDKEDYADQLLTLLSEAEKKNYKTLKKEHIAAFRKMYDRVDLKLGQSDRENLPIDQRLLAYQQDKNDPALAALYFQYGRYLLISSTRPGLLPPNLQGLWCNTINTPWNGDYHLNINLQMNMWPAEITNLSELQRPLIDWVKQQVSSGERTAKVFYNARGWVTHILGNVWEFTAPGEHPSWGATNTSAAWLCAHLYEHYKFTPDEAYLAEIYPVLKGAALFFVDMLVEDPRNGYLVTAPTTSPENAYIMDNGKHVHISAGSTMDNQIVRELFTNTIEAATILGQDSAFIRQLEAKRGRLMPTTIAYDGRIMEWLEPYCEAEPTHRHVSHLYGLYPGNEITVDRTPDLADAARQTLIARGDESTGWSMAWKINFWARLHDGEHAFKLLSDLLVPCVAPDGSSYDKGGTYPNLFCAHPPFQIDGNFGGCAGIAEMLLQSQSGVIDLLPALPSAWQTGSFKGLRVRGGGEVSARWREYRLQEVTLKAIADGDFILNIPAYASEISLYKNNKPISLPVIDSRITFSLKEGDRIEMKIGD